MAASRRHSSRALTPLSFRQGDSHVVSHESQLPFQTLGRLGDGSFGTVEMVANADGITYARKILRFHPTRSKKEKEKIFHREVAIIKSLGKHHHVVQVFATYITLTEFALLLFPVADGGDLNNFLSIYWEEQRKYWLTQELTDDWNLMREYLQRSFGCLASGLAFIHSRKIRHRDIKPGNILVHHGMIKYTDFGYSVDHSELSNGHSTGRPEPYTPKYAAPEVREWQPRGPKSDVYSLGCVYVELLSAYLGRESLSLPEIDAPGGEASRFNHLHQASHEGGLSYPCLALAGLIMNMTQQIETYRPDAEAVLHALVELPGFSCSQCQSPPLNTIDHTMSEQLSEQKRWLWSEQNQDYYVITGDRGQYDYHWWKDTVRDTDRNRNATRSQNASTKNDLAGRSHGPEPSTRQRRMPARRGKFWMVGRVFQVALEGCEQRTFVVLNIDETFVRACRIRTYSGRGTTRHDPSRAQQHTVICLETVDPTTCYLANEENGMLKHPIRVQPATSSTCLQPECRIDFAETFRIAQSQTVTNIGMVTSDYRSRLLQYWFDEGGAVDS